MRKPARSFLVGCAAAVLAACALPAAAAGANPSTRPMVIGYITALMTNKLDRFNPATDRMLRPITVGRAPWTMAIAPGGRLAYTIGTYSNVWAVNLAAGTARKVTGVGPYPYGAAFSAGGTTAYVITRRALVAIDAATRQVIKRLPLTGNSTEINRLQAAPRGHLVFLINVANGVVTEVSTATNSVVGKITVGLCTTTAIFSPDGRRMYLSTDTGLVAVNAVTGAIEQTVPVGYDCSFGALQAPGGGTLYAPGSDSLDRTTVTRIDVSATGLSTKWTTRAGTEGGGPPMVLSPDGSTLFVRTDFHASLTPINTTTGKAGAPIADRINVTHLVRGRSGRYLFASPDSPATVAVIDTVTRRLVRIFRFGDSRYFIRLVVAPGGRQVFAIVSFGPTRGWLVPISAVTGRAGRRIFCNGQPVGMQFAR